MSADCASSKEKTPTKLGQCLKPRLVLERSFVSSVTELVCSAMPSPSSSASQNSDKVEWVSFADECDLCDPSVKSYLESVVGPELPVVVTIGYTYGFQIWALLSNGECEELLFVKDGPAVFVKFLPAPKAANKTDDLAPCRPLLAVCDDSGPQFYSTVNVVSLKQNGCTVRRLNFTDPVVNVLTSDRALIITFIDKLVVLDPCSLKDRFWVKNCASDLNPNSVSLSGSWCAYPDIKINPTFQSCGGASCYDDSSYTTQVVTVAKNLSKTVTEISASLATMTGVGQPKTRTFSTCSKKSESLDNVDGIVTVLVIDNINGSEFDLQSCTDNRGILVHFLANTAEPVTYTKFNRNGTLLLTAGPSGRTFDVFLLLPHPSSPCLGAVQHLYVLQRGATIAKILDISFASDSRWVAISTANGTTHVFPITPYGGAINFRTHAGPKVVNRESRFHRSAGLDTLDNAVTSGIYHSSSSSAIAVHSPHKPKDQHPSVVNPHGSLYRAASNPRLPPYVPPQVIFAASKIKQSSANFVAAALPLVDYGTTVVSAVPAALTSAAGGALDSTCNLKQRPSSTGASYRQMAATFAPARGLKAMGSPSQRNGNENSTDCLFIMRSNGQLSEYQLAVKAFTIGQRITDENPVELHVVPTVEWPLTQSKSEQETGFPLDPNNVLLQASAIKLRLTKFSKNKGTNEKCQKSVNRDLWISQVEIVTYSGPHRRLWMGPQFTFKTYLDSQRSTPLACPSLPVRLGSNRSEPMAIGVGAIAGASTATTRGKTLGSGSLHSIPVVIEASSTGSFDHIPAGPVMEVCGSWSDNDYISCDEQEGRLRKSLADAMAETASFSHQPPPSSPLSVGRDDLSSEDLSSSDGRRRNSSGRCGGDNQSLFDHEDL